MSDPFVQLRKELISEQPFLEKYLAKKKLKEIEEVKSLVAKRPLSPRMCLRKDPLAFKKVDPKQINGEEEVYEQQGKKYKRVIYGSKDAFFVHRGLNPPNHYSTTICPKELNELENKKDLTNSARVAKAEQALIQKNILGEESEARRESLKNMTTYKSGMVDDLIKQNRAKTKLLLKNAERAIIDQQEEMRDFYSHVGSTQVLAMRELQIEDRKHFKDVGIENNDIFFKGQNKEDEGPSEYEEMVSNKNMIKEKNLKIVDVLKKQGLEKEMLYELEKEENLESAERLDALAEAELMKRMKEREVEELDKQKHFETFNAIVAYRDYLRQVRVAEDDALVNRENEFLEQKAKFNQAYLDKQNKIKEERQRLVSLVRSDLGSEMEKQEQEDMEYYYTLEKERNIQLEDQETQEKLNKKLGMESLMRDWEKITEANALIKEQELQRENEEKVRMMKFLDLENKAKNAEERKKLVSKDVNRMEIMFQINEREQQRQKALDAKSRETKLLRAEGFVREGKIKERMLERVEDFKKNGLPERFLSTIRNRYSL